MHQLALGLLLALLALPALVHGLVEHLRVERDARAAFHIGSFGFEMGGHFRLQLSGMQYFASADARRKDEYEVAFVLQRSSSDAPVRLSSSASTSGPAEGMIVAKVTTPPLVPNTTLPEDSKVTIERFPILDECFHNAQHGEDDVILRYSALSPWQHLVYERPIATAGFYHLYFSNCEPRTSVSWELDLVEYNVDTDGSKMFLSAGERYMPTILLVLAVFFAAEFLAWAVYLQRQAVHVRLIHLLMLACVLIKAASVSLDSMKYHSLKAGGVHDGWTVAYYVFAILRSMFTLILVALLATGFSYLKPFLVARDRVLLAAVIVIQALVNAAMVVVAELQQGDQSWVAANDLLTILDVACWCLILLPIVWSIRSLREAVAEDAQKDGPMGAARSMQRLQAFRSFYILTISFIYLTRVVAFLLSLTLPFEFVWVGAVFSETAQLVFFAATGFLFRPTTANPYQALEPDELEMQGLHDEHEDELDDAAEEPSQQDAPARQTPPV